MRPWFQRETSTTKPSPGLRNQALLLLLLGIVLYLAFLGSRDLWYPDEPDVAEPVREMLLSGNWVTPTQNGNAWLDYPPMVYWLALLASGVAGGLSEFTLRLPSAVAAISLALATWRFGLRRMAPGAGWLGAVVLMTAPHFAYQATNIHPDMMFAWGQGLGLFCYAAADTRERAAAWGLKILAFLLFAVAFLAKGPLGLLLPGLVLTLWHLSYGELKRWLLLVPLALVTLLAVAPWYVALGTANGGDFVWREFVAQNFARFGDASTRGHNRPWHYYLFLIWLDFGLWSLLLPAALGWHFRTRIWGDRTRRLLFLWCTGCFVFLSLAATKREAYLLPAYAPTALLIGDLLAGAWARPDDAVTHREGWWQPSTQLRGLTWITLLAGVLVALALAAALPFLPLLLGRMKDLPDNIRVATSALGPALWILLAWLTGVIATLILALRRRRAAWSFTGIAALQAGTWVVAMALVLPVFDRVTSYRREAQWLSANLPHGTELGFHNAGDEALKRSAFLFYGGMPMRELPTQEALVGWLEDDSRRVALVEGSSAERVLVADTRSARRVVRRFAIGGKNWVVLGSSGNSTLQGVDEPVQASQ